VSVRFVTQRQGVHQRTYWLVDVDVRHPGGPRERARKVSPIQTKRAAEDYERRLRAALLDPKRALSAAPTFRAFVEQTWWPTYPAAAGNRPTTVREKGIHLRVHLLPTFGALRLDQIDARAIDLFLADLRETKHLSPKSCVNILTTLRRILASAVEWGQLGAIPKMRRLRVPEAPFDFLTREESTRFVAAARDPQERALLLFALHTGARAGEELAVTWSDLEGVAVVFRRSTTRGVTGPTKSGRERSVPVTRVLAEALETLRRERREGSALIFQSSQGNALGLSALHACLHQASARAGIRRIRWHDLRHTFASTLAMAGVPVPQIQKFLGHASIGQTLRYAHLAPTAAPSFLGVLDAPLLTAACA
jgi:integrase